MPAAALSEHKIQSSAHAGGLDLHLQPVPKMLGCLQEWCAGAMVVGFKLETDAALLMRKAGESVRKYKLAAVVVNELERRNEMVEVMQPAKGSENFTAIKIAPVFQLLNDEPVGEPIEEELVFLLCHLHTDWMKENMKEAQKDMKGEEKDKT